MAEQNLLMKNGCVVTADPNRRDLPGADIRISGGTINEIGVDLTASIGKTVI